jgi:hypothetical protein
LFDSANPHAAICDEGKQHLQLVEGNRILQHEAEKPIAKVIIYLL